MNVKFNKNAKVEQLTKVVLSHGEEKGLIVKDPLVSLGKALAHSNKIFQALSVSRVNYLQSICSNSGDFHSKSTSLQPILHWKRYIHLWVSYPAKTIIHKIGI